MKKIILSVVALLSLSCGAQELAPIIFTAPYNEDFDATRAGEVFARSFWDEYEIDITYTDPNTGEQNFMFANANLRGQVIAVDLNKKVVFEKGTAILPGIPLPEGGMKDVHIYVDGTKEGIPLVHGADVIDYIRPGGRISITLMPLGGLVHLMFPISELPIIPEGAGLHDIRLIGPDGNPLGYYHPWVSGGGFMLWNDDGDFPLRNPFYGTIIVNGYPGSFGSVLVDPAKIWMVENYNGAALNLELAGKVVRIVDIDNSSLIHQGVHKLDGVIINEPYLPNEKGKSFIYENKDDSELKLKISGNLKDNGTFILSVYSVNHNGLQPCLEEQIFSWPGIPFTKEFKLDRDKIVSSAIVIVVNSMGVEFEKNQFELELHRVE